MVLVGARGIGIAGHIEPVPAPSLAITRRREKPVDYFRERAGRRVAQEGVYLGFGGREAGEVEGRSPVERFFEERGVPLTWLVIVVRPGLLPELNNP